MLSKYQLKIAVYQAKSFLHDIFSKGRRGIKKRARLFSILSVFVIAGLIFSLSVYGLNLKTQAATSVTSGSGCYGTSWITVEYLTAAPISGNAPLAVTFTATVYGYNPPFYYNWDFNGDGAWDESGTQGGAGAGSCTAYTTTHTYTNSGSYNVIFGISDYYAAGSRTSKNVNINIAPNPCGNGTCDVGEDSTSCPADCPVPPPPPTNVTNQYNFNYNGVSIHTKAENTSRPEMASSATVKRGVGDIIKFTLTITNADTTEKSTDVKFALPAGFTFKKMISGTIPPNTPRNSSCTGTLTATGDTAEIYWCGYMAPVGESQIIFETAAP